MKDLQGLFDFESHQMIKCKFTCEKPSTIIRENNQIRHTPLELAESKNQSQILFHLKLNNSIYYPRFNRN